MNWINLQRGYEADERVDSGFDEFYKQSIENIANKDYAAIFISKITKAYSICKQHGFNIELNPLEDCKLKITAFLNNKFLDIEVSEGDDLSLTLEEGIGNEYKTIYEDKVINFDKLESHLLEIK